ncbi:MAG: UDP-N-acetylmuramate dehydrogenase [Clostridia bacterium]|nr:UDP-N-acetylmuramate dehydrogenase [Clostridia bacterium]
MFESFNAMVNAPMSEHTTLKLGGPADYLVFPRSAEEINALFAEAGAYNLPVTVIGHGSNLLVLDGGIRGLVICIGKNMRTITREGNMITAQAGAMLGSVAVEAAEAGLSGLEFASGIPGTVGGGVTMNAGAYNGEMSQVVKTVKALSPGGKEIVLSREEMDFSYRHSAVTEKNLIVTEATFELQPGDPATIRAKMSELNARRAEKQPLDVPSAGSTFKRPEGFFAAALIDQCGLKGYSIGGARVSMKHAGFLVNTGNSSKDFYDLMQKVQQIVDERVGVKLEPEIRILGEELLSENQGSSPQMIG